MIEHDWKKPIERQLPSGALLFVSPRMAFDEHTIMKLAPSRALRPKRITYLGPFIEAESGVRPGFDVIDIKVGPISQMKATGSLPSSVFSIRASLPPLNLDTASQVAMFTIQIRNRSTHLTTEDALAGGPRTCACAWAIDDGLRARSILVDEVEDVLREVGIFESFHQDGP